MRAVLVRMIARVAVAAVVLLAHRCVGGWVGRHDPLLDPWLVAPALAVLIPLRFAAWFVVVPWVAAGTLADLWGTRRETARGGPRAVGSSPAGAP